MQIFLHKCKKYIYKQPTFLRAVYYHTGASHRSYSVVVLQCNGHTGEAGQHC